MNKEDESIFQKIVRKERTIGQKAADNLAKYAGSWGFILVFVLLLILWMIANLYAWAGKWDPYPFIFLNLILSCLAAIQAPIILMSQNRQAQKDRIKMNYDYKINKHADEEIERIKKQLDKIEALLKHKK